MQVNSINQTSFGSLYMQKDAHVHLGNKKVSLHDKDFEDSFQKINDKTGNILISLDVVEEPDQSLLLLTNFANDILGRVDVSRKDTKEEVQAKLADLAEQAPKYESDALYKKANDFPY